MYWDIISGLYYRVACFVLECLQNLSGCQGRSLIDCTFKTLCSSSLILVYSVCSATKESCTKMEFFRAFDRIHYSSSIIKSLSPFVQQGRRETKVIIYNIFLV